MLTINGLEYRNLEEQVRKNKEDILYILEEEGTLNAFGIKVVGQIANASGLPDPATYTGDFGDAYAVGTESPYVMYIYTRANGTHPNNYWFNIGRFPVPGPQGEKGDPGIGNANLSNTPGNSDTNGYTQKAVNGIVQNPNLLINPNFAINQRGQTSYTGVKYGVDRWKGVNANTVVTPQAVGINVQGANFQFAQDVDNYAMLDGYTLTLSIKANGVVYSASGVYNKDVDYSFCTCAIAGGYVARIRSYEGTCRCQILGIASGEALSIEWAKLEIGSVATEFSPPNIAEELIKCYRYYKKITNMQQATYSGLNIIYGDGAGARMIVENTFRVKPTITINGAFVVVANGEYKTVSAMAIQSFNSTNVVVKLTLNAGITEGVCGYLQSNNSPDAYIAFDAEI